MADLKQFENTDYLNIETFRKSGVGVKTPIWFAREGDMLYLWTGADSAKVKRIRNKAAVNIAPCTASGAITGEWLEARASVDDSDAAVQHVVSLLRAKMGFRFRAETAFSARAVKNFHSGMAMTPPDQPTSCARKNSQRANKNPAIE